MKRIFKYHKGHRIILFNRTLLPLRKYRKYELIDSLFKVETVITFGKIFGYSFILALIEKLGKIQYFA